MPFDNFNHAFFLVINAPDDPAPWLVAAVLVLANWVVYALALWMVIAWIQSNRQSRCILADAFLAVVIALGFSQVISSLWYHPRPFAVPLGNQLLAHAADSSFPSDHGIFMFAIALTLTMHKTSRGWGWLFLTLGIGVAWSRIFLGVHYPLDMAGSFIVALVSIAIVRLISPFMRAKIYPVLFKLYAGIITALRLPEKFFPRSEL